MNIAERIYETVKPLPEQFTSEVLNFAEGLKAKQAEEDGIRREYALTTLAKFQESKFNHEESYGWKSGYRLQLDYL